MKYVRHTLKLFALSSIALTGIMCSQKNDTESDADAYFASRYQDDIKPACGFAAQKIRECKKIRNTCWDDAHNTYLDTGRNEAFDVCYDDFLKCINFGPEICELKTIKAFVLDVLTDGKELGEISPELAWDGTGAMGGIEVADKRCQVLADKNKLDGQFKAFLSSGNRDFYKEINPKYLDLPFENVYGTILSGNVVTLNDLRDSSKVTSDGMWDAIMFFRANKSRVSGCNFPSGFSYDMYTGMGDSGSPESSTFNCSNWTSISSNKSDTLGFLAVIFDRGGMSITPTEPASKTSWKMCQPNISFHKKNILDKNPVYTGGLGYTFCGYKTDGLLCVQVEK